jgi:hypothetical protein
MFYGTVSEIKLPFGNEGERFHEAMPTMQTILPDANVPDSVRRYVNSVAPNPSRNQIITPKAVGILQMKGIPVHLGTTASHRDLNHITLNTLESMAFGEQLTHATRLTIDDTFESSLIHVAYDSRTELSRELVVQSLGGSVPERIRISPISRLPPFYQKTPDLSLTLCTELEKLLLEKPHPRRVKDFMKPTLAKIEEETKVYGSNGFDYNMYAPLKKIYEMLCLECQQ